MTTDLAALAALLRERASAIAATPVVAGFDGFVDEMIQVVGERRGLDTWSAMRSMADLGRLLQDSAGRNGLREIVVRSTDAGGCAVNMGDTLAALGLRLDYVGTVGRPRHPAFDAFAARCASSTALGASYGRTLAFEFADGKFMFSAVEQLGEVTPQLLERACADGAIPAAFARARLVALNNWTLYPHMTACWRWLQDRVLARCPGRPWLFIDLVDPSGRGREDVADMLDAVRGFERSHRTSFGLNLTEAGVVARVLGIGDRLEPDAAAMQERAAAIRGRLGVSEVVIHNVRMNAVARADGAAAVPSGPRCLKPRKSVGAGDRFNAGYCLGLVLDLAADQRVALGNATAGFFVRNARSGSLAEIAGFLDEWARGRLDAEAAAGA